MREEDTRSVTQKKQRLAEIIKNYKQQSPVDSLQFPLSFAQIRLWYLEQLVPNTTTYLIPLVFEISGNLRISLLNECLRELIIRHASLRTHIKTINNIPHQCIHSASHFATWEMQEMDLILTDINNDELRHKVECLLNQPISLDEDILFRINLLKLDKNRFIFCMNIHHIISDGWSLQILFTELKQIYSKKISQESYTLAPIRKSYGEFTQLSENSITTGHYQEALTYWTEKLRNAPQQLDFALDYPRNQQNFTSAQFICAMGNELPTVIKEFAKQNQTSTFNILLATLYLLLSRYSHQDDIVVGTPAINRLNTEFQNTFGLFVNILALRLQGSPTKTFTELLQQTKQTVNGALKFQDFPFEKLVEALAPNRYTSATPLFQVMLAQIIPMDTFTLPDCKISPYDTQTTSAKFDLTFYFREQDNNITIYAEYNTAIFKEATIQRMLFHWQEILKKSLHFPNELLPICSAIPVQEEVYLKQWNHGKIVTVPADLSLIHLFEEQVARKPEKIALFYQNEEFNYRRLNNWSNAIALSLSQAGIQKNTVVGVCFERDIARVAAILGILKIGAVYVPIDPKNPPERVQYIAKQAEVHSLLMNGQTLTYDLNLPIITCPPEPNTTLVNPPLLEFNLDDPAYIIFTSGSTGKPKGVIGTHGGILNRLYWNWHTYPFTATDVCMQQAALSFVDSVAEIFVPLLSGTPAVIFSEEMVRDPILFCDAIELHQITRVLMIPSLLKHVLYECKRSNIRLQSIRYWSLSGEALSKHLCDLFFAIFPQKILINIYGSCEVAADATYYEMVQPPLTAMVPIGKPIDNMNIYILDRNQLPVPIGVIGEIYIQGLGVAKGYINQEEVTQLRFLNNLRAIDKQNRLFRTGDFGCFLEDGNIAFHGRKDNQIKIRGMRVELNEIENQINQHEKIDDVVVLMVHEPIEHLTAFFTVKANHKLTASELHIYLQELLPNYMIPTDFIFLSEFPRTTTGKIDRQALLNINQRTESHADNENYNELENTILKIWQQKLKTNNISINDNFFDLGGHSLLLIELRNTLQTELNKSISVVDLFKYPTIRSFANFLSVKEPLKKSSIANTNAVETADDIAIIGMSGRFPQAQNIDIFWQNLLANKLSTTKLADEELSEFGKYLKQKHPQAFVNIAGPLENIEYFDADLFGFKPTEAEILDPQQRVFLECVWEAFENAAYNPETYTGKIGVYAGCAQNTYMLTSLLDQLDITDPMKLFSITTSNNENYLATRTAYVFNLRGPSLSIQTACSTSLVAIATAARALLNNECDMAIAGGVTVKVPQNMGYVHQQGSLTSADGTCLAFDEKANGTMFSNGAGAVLLKRLSAAKQDGDVIHAVIKGCAINNDGRDKVGYTAPSIHGQIDVIESAYRNAQIAPETISYIEAHGTGTQLGDPIELTALQHVFANTQHCFIGSVKTNIGHLDAAAGIAGMIKVIKAMQHGILPATLFFEKGNPKFDWQSSCFEVVKKNTPWQEPRRAGISSFGIGGTNVHVILEQAPARLASKDNGTHVFILSAASTQALIEIKNNLKIFLTTEPHINLGDLAYSLAIGRKVFAYRTAFVCDQLSVLIDYLERDVNFLSPLDISKEQSISLQEALAGIDKNKERNKWLNLLAAWWLKGNDVDWQLVFTAGHHKRISLPSYPFQRKHYWKEPQLRFLQAEKNNLAPLESSIITFQEQIKSINHTDLPQQICVCWQAILGVDTIGVDDNFFDLGGNSLLATQINSWVKNKFAIEFPLEQFFLQPTISHTAELIESLIFQKIDSLSEKEIEMLL